jgi:HEAT repeat protein
MNSLSRPVTVVEKKASHMGILERFRINKAIEEVLNTTKDEWAFQYLVEALEDEDWWVRERAMNALANLDDQRAVPALLRSLRSMLEAKLITGNEAYRKAVNKSEFEPFRKQEAAV